ncbi:MAG: hypothetical protein PVH64_03040 [Bacillota bacterium]
MGIPIISSPYWDDIPAGEQFAIEDTQMEKEFKVYSEMHQPARDINNFFPRAILMQIGNDDKHFDVNKVNNFYQRLKEFYKDIPENIKLIIYSNTKHGAIRFDINIL